jgi:septum site-determining protein MinC
MVQADHAPCSFRFRARSFMALLIAPQQPISTWLTEVDKCLARSPGFFARKSVVVDVSGLSLTKRNFVALVAALKTREIRILGVEGMDASWADDGLPPRLNSTGTTAPVEIADGPPSQPADAPPVPTPSLLIDTPLRSGQSIIHPGDVTIIGSVASGAEIVAAGSIHIYGALRGRALAGAYGNAGARIFCRRLEAELMSIGGYYAVADEWPAHLHKNSIHAWLDGEALKITPLN